MNISEIPKSIGIYKLTNKINGKIYIGKTTTSFLQRIKEHLRHSEQVIDNALKKYSINNFNLEVFELNIDNNILLFLESSLIYELNSINNGYNICLFSSSNINTPMKQETKDKLSKILKEKYSRQDHHSLGICLSKKHKDKISLATKGNNNPMFGRKHSDISLNKIRLARAKQIIKPESIIKGVLKRQKPIKQIDKNTNEVIKIWTSQIDACKQLNLDSGGICRASKGYSKSCGGFKWEYV